MLRENLGREKIPGIVQEMSVGRRSVPAATEHMRELVRQRRISVIRARQPVRPVADPRGVEVRRGRAAFFPGVIRDGKRFRSVDATDQERSGVGSRGRQHGRNLGDSGRHSGLGIDGGRVDPAEPAIKVETDKTDLPESDPAGFQDPGRQADLAHGPGLSPRRASQEEDGRVKAERKTWDAARMDVRAG